MVLVCRLICVHPEHEYVIWMGGHPHMWDDLSRISANAEFPESAEFPEDAEFPEKCGTPERCGIYRQTKTLPVRLAQTGG